MAKHEDLAVPIFDSLELVYGRGYLLEEGRLHFDNLKSKFQKVFRHPPEVFARSPGRVNSIGEHIDCEGYSVLSMAIRKKEVDNNLRISQRKKLDKLHVNLKGILAPIRRNGSGNLCYGQGWICGAS
ncbi:hypothetical protein QN277_004131 [Acacia crassicarpa]|uniref:Galactokinase N-terminal domain-containing protein n=1 Tax=Acacia crassicarpa TaxID=499986 RepID=A0AAE1IZR3_9FABA|nr:hypothetical protein QN277_004131 [Acacia crassicarpa]